MARTGGFCAAIDGDAVSPLLRERSSRTIENYPELELAYDTEQ